jgi:alpha-ketoglutarate-dependent taurine dioxygenase
MPEHISLPSPSQGTFKFDFMILNPDTLWASGYELYDRISKPYQKFLEGLTATFVQPSYDKVIKQFNHQLYTQPRGSPENVGSEFVAVHPVIRTNPVTGWKTLFAVGNHIQRINGLEKEESDGILQWFTRLITENHDLQVRYRWQNRSDVGKSRSCTLRQTIWR